MELLKPIRTPMTEEQRDQVVKALARPVASHLERKSKQPEVGSEPPTSTDTEIQNSRQTAFVDSKVVQVRGRGTLTLPARIRSRYALADGDPMTILDLDGVLVLSPKVGAVSGVAAEIKRLADDD